MHILCTTERQLIGVNILTLAIRRVYALEPGSAISVAYVISRLYVISSSYADALVRFIRTYAQTPLEARSGAIVVEGLPWYWEEG